MMASFKRPCVLLASCLSLLFLPGCWDYVKINDRAQIIGIGVDKVEGNDKLLSYTFQIPVFTSGDKSQSAQGGMSHSGSSPTSNSRNFTEEGHGLAEAMQRAQQHYERTFFLSNLQTIVLSEQLSGGQIRAVVAEMIRTPALDKLAFLLCTPQSAKEVLESQQVAAPADMMDRFLGVTMKDIALSTRTHLWEFWRDSHTVGVEPHAPLVLRQVEGLKIYGLLGFYGSTPVVTLSSADAMYYNFIGEHVRGGALWFPEGTRAFEVGNIRSKCKMSVTQQGKQIVLHAKIRVWGEVLQDESHGLSPLNSLEIKQYEQLMEQQMRKKVTGVLATMQQHHADVYGFGQYYYVHHPDLQEELVRQWGEMFSQAKPDVQVNVVVLQKGNLM